MQKAIAKEAAKSFRNKVAIITLIFQLVHIENQLQDAIGDEGEVHFFLTTRTNNGGKGELRLFPIVKN